MLLRRIAKILEYAGLSVFTNIILLIIVYASVMHITSLYEFYSFSVMWAIPMVPITAIGIWLLQDDDSSNGM